MTFSLVVPIYNEEDNVGPLVEAIEKAAPAEAILVDDGSTDGTWTRLTEAASLPWIRLIRFEVNAGQSAAFFAGIQAASSDVVVTMDADLQNDPADIPKLLEGLRDADMVCGWRTQRRDTFSKRVASRIGNAVRRFFTRDGVPDTGCSLKAFRRNVIPPWAYFRGMHRFMPTLLRYYGFQVIEHPVSHHPRRSGVSKYGVMNRAFRALRDLFAVRWMRTRIRRLPIVVEDSDLPRAP
jgi:glycosyltransferase involved in cell wall biosynthesis